MSIFDKRRGMGDLPADLVRGGSLYPPSQNRVGWDVTGAKNNPQGMPIPISSDSPWYQTILAAFKVGRRQCTFLSSLAQLSSANPIQIRTYEKRTYLLLQNNSTANVLIGFGYTPTSSNGLILQSGAVYEPFQVPGNEIFGFGTIAGPQNLLCIYAVD